MTPLIIMTIKVTNNPIHLPDNKNAAPLVVSSSSFKELALSSLLEGFVSSTLLLFVLFLDFPAAVGAVVEIVVGLRVLNSTSSVARETGFFVGLLVGGFFAI
jgi:hypothetical protein